MGEYINVVETFGCDLMIPSCRHDFRRRSTKN